MDNLLIKKESYTPNEYRTAKIVMLIFGLCLGWAITKNYYNL